MLERILIAGAGGQGILVIGRLLAKLALDRVPHLTFFPSYGAEVRGGTSHCQVVLSDEEIPSPICDTFDSLLIMNQASLDRFLDQREAAGLLVVNRSLCGVPDLPGVVAVDATREAARLGDTRAANFIMLGAYLAARPLVEPATVVAEIREAFASKGPALVDLNTTAFRLGRRAGG